VLLEAIRTLFVVWPDFYRNGGDIEIINNAVDKIKRN